LHSQYNATLQGQFHYSLVSGALRKVPKKQWITAIFLGQSMALNALIKMAAKARIRLNFRRGRTSLGCGLHDFGKPRRGVGAALQLGDVYATCGLAT
jgi:hypothetical protein